MSIVVKRDTTRKMKHIVSVGRHQIVVDEPEANGGEDLGPTAHELYDSALVCESQADSAGRHRGHGGA